MNFSGCLRKPAMISAERIFLRLQSSIRTRFTEIKAVSVPEK